MSGFGKQQKMGSGDKAIGGFAIVMALVLAFLLTPIFHGETVEWATGYMSDHYGYWLASIGWYVWFVLSAFLTYFGALLAMIALQYALVVLWRFFMLLLGR
ncbi:hypothetical protein [Stakelama tenebrarum]|uniref:Uncharacterized protein n=1 Tax=Stakelama tenebrarum TaxID=2711215 RepID=A0A6G6Y410_9SPHN|nr:hypothetical protein [Sphingosinithalassobacter tenebrarum]QIG79458.1 hypothetical protein G5C33_06430 [Sphingosinithalassobacter tenebrarum]